MVGEFRSGPVVGTALISGETFAQKGVMYAAVDGLAIVEGDIVIGTVEEVQAAMDAQPQFSIGVTPGVGNARRWPNATVPYDIDPALTNQQRVTDAIAHWEANTRIRFVLRTAANASQYPDYVHFQPAGGCSSMVGRQGGRQNINLGSGCSTGNTIHEIGHAVGLWHEQSREDRDTWVRIVWANIDPAMQHNFSQHISDGDDLGAYDYGSVMHYPPNAFSINGQNTIVPLQTLPPGVTLGQRSGLSAGDIAGVHTMYPGSGPTIKEIAKDPTRDPVTIKEIRKDPIQDPTTIKEVRKDPIADPTVKEIRKDPIQDPTTIKEVRKDPIQDPTTIKEIRKDPIFDTRIERTGVGGGPGLPGGQDFGGGISPFIVATPSRAGYEASDYLAEATMQVQELAEALMALEQQQSDLLQAYEAAVQNLENLSQGRM